MLIEEKTKPDNVGFNKLISLQDKTEKMITEDPNIPEAVRSTLWEIYQNGQEAGIIQGLLQVAKTMQEAEFSSKIITQMTNLPTSDLAMWEEAHQGRDDSKN